MTACIPSHNAPVAVGLPTEGPCLACSLGHHPDVDHDGCGCPCGWPPIRRAAAIIATVRADRRQL